MKFGQLSIGILIEVDLVYGILGQDLGLDFHRFNCSSVHKEQTVENIDADFAFRHLLHLLV